MVAYSFQRRFVPMIEAGYKHQTVRAERARHARPGETMQLYQGMRTRTCRKILPDPICTCVRPIHIVIRAGLIERIEVRGLSDLWKPDPDAFAISDGFESREDMSAFWAERHPSSADFVGVLIEWAAGIAGAKAAA